MTLMLLTFLLPLAGGAVILGTAFVSTLRSSREGAEDEQGVGR